MMDYRLEEWGFGWELREFGGSAIDDIGDGLAVRVDGVILLLGGDTIGGDQGQ